MTGHVSDVITKLLHGGHTYAQQKTDKHASSTHIISYVKYDFSWNYATEPATRIESNICLGIYAGQHPNLSSILSL